MTDDRRRRPPLREQLDRELAPLAATAQARRRLSTAIARPAADRRTGRRRRVAAGPATRWAAPLVAAAVSLVIAVPAVLTHRLPLGGPAPAATVDAPAHPAGGTARTIGPSDPVPATSAGPATGPSPARPTPVEVTGTQPAAPIQALLTARPTVARAGSTVVATLSWVVLPLGRTPATRGSRAPAAAAPGSADPGTAPAAGPSPSTAPSDPAGTVVILWGDGQHSVQPARCASTHPEQRASLSFRHAYRSPGRYQLVVKADPQECWFSGTVPTAVVVVR